MCKEDASVIRAGQQVVDANKQANVKGQYRVMRKGKTRRDKEARWRQTAPSE